VPFLVEDQLLGVGATFSEVKNWGVHVVADGLLVIKFRNLLKGNYIRTSFIGWVFRGKTAAAYGKNGEAFDIRAGMEGRRSVSSQTRPHFS
jgi:hypothetical protein